MSNSVYSILDVLDAKLIDYHLKSSGHIFVFTGSNETYLLASRLVASRAIR